jgi:ankyrin repeat protein
LHDNDADIEYRTAQGESAIFFAAKNGKDGAVKVLLDMGANIEKRNESMKSLMDVAVDYPTILRMVSEKDKNGKLAETVGELHTDVDNQFKAKVVFFIDASGVHRPSPRDIPIDVLLTDPASVPAPETGDISFKWFHLPANNVSLLNP